MTVTREVHMAAAIGLILLIIAAFLKATAKDPSVMTWLIIVGAILVAVDVIWGWRRAGAGYYRSGPGPTA